jgi:hypothetical protein
MNDIVQQPSRARRPREMRVYGVEFRVRRDVHYRTAPMVVQQLRRARRSRVGVSVAILGNALQSWDTVDPI